MPPSADRRSPLALIVLATVAERPMHAYAVYQLIQSRGKNEVVPIANRATLYPVLDRLARSGLVEVDRTERDSGRPERTVYRITPQGSATVREWLVAYLASGSTERSGFVAALSLSMMLAPAEVLSALRDRQASLALERAVVRDGLRAGVDIGLPELFQLDERYRLAILDTDIAVTDDLVSRLASGELTWDEEWIAAIAQQLEGQGTGAPSGA